MNIRSMTGYGKGEAASCDKKIVVEIRTLNGKQMDLSLKMPSAYREKEFDIRSLISSKLLRGKCDVFITTTANECATTATINGDAFENYYNQLLAIGNKLNFDYNSNDLVQSILRLPDVLQSEKNEKVEVSQEEYTALFEAVNQALVNIDSFRAKEGEVLLTDILSRIDNIENLKNSIAPYAPERVETVKTRLRESIENLKISVDENRFEAELIFYLEKYDITEEMVRLQQHLTYFRETSKESDGVGRKLGFISQEIGREINTTGSKANHSEIQKIVVKMKDELEKIKEQTLNLL